MRRAPEKHSTFFALTEAMARPGCFLCRLEQEAVVRGLDSLLYESVNDPGLRTRLREGGGFCDEHGRLLAEIGDAMGVAMLMRDQVATVVTRLDSSPKAQGRGASPPDCPCCEIRRATAERHLSTLDDFGADAELHRALGEIRALCLPHWHAAGRRLRSERVRRLLRDTLAARVEALSGDLAEFIRKQDHRFREEKITEAEAASWRGAISLLHGWRFSLEELRRRR
jgi:nitrogen fixation protein